MALDYSLQKPVALSTMFLSNNFCLIAIVSSFYIFSITFVDQNTEIIEGMLS